VTGLEAIARWRRPPDGLQDFDPGRDLAGVIELLEIGFRHDLAARDQRWLAELGALSATGPLLSVLARVFPPAISGMSGYVWYDGGRIVANASLLRGPDDTWAVANVVTRPEYRRQGIASALMDAVLDAADRHRAREVQLQVRDDNAAALALYGQLGFQRAGARTLLHRTSPGAAPRVGEVAGGPAIVEWGRVGVSRATDLLERSGSLSGRGRAGVVRDAWRATGWAGALDDWLHGRVTRRWAAQSGDAYLALAVLRVHPHPAPHQVEVVTDPSCRGTVEGPLVDAALDASVRFDPREVEADLDAEEAPAIALLERAGFTRVRTLILMVCDLE
jgi:ribosomal protein S18 acetylase RimI-like enzyme